MTEEEIIEKYEKENKLVIYDDGTLESDQWQIRKMLKEYGEQFRQPDVSGQVCKFFICSNTGGKCDRCGKKQCMH